MKLFKLILLLVIILGITSCEENYKEFEFEYIKNQLILSVHIEGKGPFKMLLDTGVDPSVIDLDLSKKLSIRFDSLAFGMAEGRGSDEIKVYPVIINDISIDKENYGQIDALAMNLKHLGSPLGIELHGILGYSFLKERIFKIDYQNKLIQIFNSREDLDSSIKNESCIVDFFHDGEDIIPIVNLSINGIEFIGSFDTGSSLNIEVYDHYIQKFDIKIDSSNVSQIIGAQGKKDVIKSKIEKIQISKFVFTDQEVTISSIKDKSQLREGNIGNKFIQNFVISFDYINNEMIFERAK